MEQLREQAEARSDVNDEGRDTARQAQAWKEHDRLPDAGGPWLYVVDKAAWDDGRMLGAWVPAEMDAYHVAKFVGAIAGQPLTRSDLAVVDQLRVDDDSEMVDEDYFTPGGWLR